MNSHTANQNSEFRAGRVEPLAFDLDRITKRENGFTIKLPSESPIPTPMVYQNRLYVSGGFSSKEYYCFDARTGDFIWGVQLDDDGPSSAVPYDESIIFGCESCTIFALAAKTGEMQWSHWLGDPLLSMPTVAGGRVFAVYPAVPPSSVTTGDTSPADDPILLESSTPSDSMTPTHVAICLDAQSGETVWQQWIDSDCMTAPVAVGDDLYLASLTGIVYQFGQQDGSINLATRLRATSVPVVADDDLYLTRRADGDSGEIAECIAMHDRSTNRLQYVAARRLAPYLDQAVQRAASYSTDAAEFESSNGIGGGFGGGFGGGSGGGFGSGGSFAVEDELSRDVPASDKAQPVSPMNSILPQPSDAKSSDPLLRTELQAADAIGLGNVSTLQSFQGSRVLYWKGRLYNCMGDQIVCTSAESGKTVWTKQVEGNLNEVGGHLATPPVAAGKFLFVATVNGDVLQMKPQSGEIAASFQVDAPVRFPPVVHEGRIYVSTQDGQVVCIDTANTSLTGWSMWGGDAGHRNVVLQD
ncbi:MAG: PQQ-binding-like beta-propeller repeat protein [Pirellulaceae bacterium]|nr:PQQ-binding-like beta-propeller repeat protein [Pirellulaceae bacterium]